MGTINIGELGYNITRATHPHTLLYSLTVYNQLGKDGMGLISQLSL